MQPSLFTTIRRLVATRSMRIVSMLVFAMCTVTWVAQTVSSVRDNPRVPGSQAALALAAAGIPTKAVVAVDQAAAAVDCSDGTDVEECEDEVIALVALDETHDIKLFFLREFTHLLQPVVGRVPRNRDFGAITRMSSETFRPPDHSVGVQGRLLQA